MKFFFTIVFGIFLTLLLFLYCFLIPRPTCPNCRSIRTTLAYCLDRKESWVCRHCRHSWYERV